MNLHAIPRPDEFHNAPWWTEDERGNRGSLRGRLLEVKRSQEGMLIGLWESDTEKSLRFTIFLDEWHDDAIDIALRNQSLRESIRQWEIYQFHTQEFMHEVEDES